MSIILPDQSVYNESPKRGSFMLSLRSKFEAGPESPSRSRRLLLKFTSDKKSRRLSNASAFLLKSQVPIKSTLRMSITEAARSNLRVCANESSMSAFKSRDDLPLSKRLSLALFNMSKASRSDPSLPIGHVAQNSTSLDSHKDTSPSRPTRFAGSFSSISSVGGDLELSFEYSEDEDTNPTETSYEDLTQSAKLSGNQVNFQYQFKQSPTVPAGLATMLDDFDNLDDAQSPRGLVFEDVNYEVLKVLAPLFESIRIIDSQLEIPAYDFDNVDVANCFAEPYYT